MSTSEEVKIAKKFKQGRDCGTSTACRAFEGLSEQQFIYANVFLSTHSTKQACEAAGYALTNDTRVSKLPKVRAYIDKRMAESVHELVLSYDKKLVKLSKVVNKAISDDIEEIDKKVEIGLKALDLMNKMQGHNSAEKHINLNANVELDPLVKSTQELLDSLIAKNERDY